MPVLIARFKSRLHVQVQWLYSIGIKVNATRKTVSVSLFLYDLLPLLHVYTEVCKNILKVILITIEID